MEVVFYICTDLADHIQVILGRVFLDDTESLTKNRHRLVNRTSAAARLVRPRLMRLTEDESPTTLQMAVFLNSNSEPSLGNVDTGAEVEVIFPACVKKLGFCVRDLQRSDHQAVQFVDGSVQKLSGKVVVKVSIPENMATLTASRNRTPMDLDHSESPSADI